MTDTIPQRFASAVDAHLVFNFAGVDKWPLILGVFGRPGDGKSYQVRAQLQKRNVAAVTINAADLESDRAGMPGKMILDLYKDAGDRLDEGNLAALVIDDVDTTVGEWENSTTTVNHQQVLAQLMHLADNPTSAAAKILRRIPVILTGNDLSKIYPPLRRPGRMRAFPWLPTDEERRLVVSEILNEVAQPDVVDSLLSSLPDAPIAFFSDLRIELLSATIAGKLELFAGRLQSLAQADGKVASEVRNLLLGARLDQRGLTDLALASWNERETAMRSYVSGGLN